MKLFIDLLTTNPVLYVSLILAVTLSIVLHELGHGFAAIRQGDDTPRIRGHMTWKPWVHMPGFSLVLLFLAGISYGLMPVNPMRFRSRYGSAIVAAAGPAVNLLLALVALTALGLWMRLGGPAQSDVASTSMDFLYHLGRINLVLFALNLMPAPPLDGSTVLADFSPAYRRIARNPANQPFFQGAFILVLIFAGRIFEAADSVVLAYVRLLLGA